MPSYGQTTQPEDDPARSYCNRKYSNPKPLLVCPYESTWRKRGNMSKESVSIFVMRDGDENSREDCSDETAAIIKGAVTQRTPWRVTTTEDDQGRIWNKHERYSFFRKQWEAR